MINVSLEYLGLFSVSARHNYYSENFSNEFQLAPTPNTQRVCNQLGLVIRKERETPDLVVLYDDSRAEALKIILERSDSFKFSFWLYCQNPYFTNFTNLNHNETGKVFYARNKEGVSFESSYNLLHETDFISSEERYSLYPSSFPYYSKNEDSSIIIEDYNGNEILKGEAVEGRYWVNLKNLEEGLYKIFEDGELVKKFVYYANDLLSKPIALIDVYLNGNWKDLLIDKLIGDQPLQTPNFKISFERRSTFWKYFIIPKYTTNLKNIAINSLDQQVEFTSSQEVKVSNDRAYMFESSQSLPLEQRTSLHFQLKNGGKSGANGGKTILKRLPVPSVEMIKPSQNEDNITKVYSEVIVYI